jgi:hypothetical protein
MDRHRAVKLHLLPHQLQRLWGQLITVLSAPVSSAQQFNTTWYQTWYQAEGCATGLTTIISTLATAFAIVSQI